jgi:uncharacterized MnhB-related membrane protein
MTNYFLQALLFVVVSVGLLSLLYRDLFVSVILLAVFSFLSALLFYTAHAPDVAITEAAVGAGMTTFIFIWAVSVSSPGGKRPGGAVSFRISDLFDALLAAAAAVLLYLFLPELNGGPTMLRDQILAEAYRDTGALNLVSAVYLGYRAFDTFGETIVLLCAVSGSVFLLSKGDRE